MSVKSIHFWKQFFLQMTVFIQNYVRITIIKTQKSLFQNCALFADAPCKTRSFFFSVPFGKYTREWTWLLTLLDSKDKGVGFVSICRVTCQIFLQKEKRESLEHTSSPNFFWGGHTGRKWAENSRQGKKCDISKMNFC